jgi:saccharopine dehydrogenase (NAD+, L-lysine-forming)
MILIAGGYGVVGTRIAADLAEDYPDAVVVAGRDGSRATATAAALRNGVRGRELDVTVPSSVAKALEDITVVVNCIDQPDRALLHAAIKRGIAFTDITPHLTELGRGARYEAIDAAAKASGARVVLGTGIVPGVSSVMVRALVSQLGGVDSIQTSLLLSANDASGPASFDYFLQELAMPFQVHIDGADRPARAFSDPQRVVFPPPVGARRAYLFPFSDQVLYPRTLNARTVRTRLALEPAPLARLLAFLARTPAVGLVSRDSVRHKLASGRRKGRPGRDAQFALRVDVACGEDIRHATLIGRGQADAAAAGAAGVVRGLLRGDVHEPGAWMPEQAIEPDPSFAHLARRGLDVGGVAAGVSEAARR